jgi:hypothetical protein
VTLRKQEINSVVALSRTAPGCRKVGEYVVVKIHLSGMALITEKRFGYNVLKGLSVIEYFFINQKIKS